MLVKDLVATLSSLDGNADLNIHAAGFYGEWIRYDGDMELDIVLEEGLVIFKVSNGYIVEDDEDECISTI